MKDRRRNGVAVGKAAFLLLALCALASVAGAELVVRLTGANGQLSFQPDLLPAYPNETIVFVRDPGVSQCTLYQTEQRVSCLKAENGFEEERTEDQSNFTLQVAQPGGTSIPYACLESCSTGGPRGSIQVLRLPTNSTLSPVVNGPVEQDASSSFDQRTVLLIAGAILLVLLVATAVAAFARSRRHQSQKSLPPQPDMIDQQLAYQRLHEGAAAWNARRAAEHPWRMA